MSDTIIDICGIAGHECTAGFLSFAGNKVPDADGTLVAILRQAGAGEFFYLTHGVG